jgi:starch-binding outer membrane protein, SusD/RagB family
MKINLLKYKILPLITVFLFILSSCEKKVLDLQPYSSFSDQSAFEDEARITLAVTGVYDAAQSGFYANGQVRGYPFGAASVQQGDMRGEDMANNAGFYLITYEGIYNNVTANNSYMFQTLYALINKANLVIEGVTGAV